MDVQSILNSMSRIKVASDGYEGTPHVMLPGRTTKTVRKAGVPTTLVTLEDVKKKKKKKPVEVAAIGVTPKMDINFSIKLGSDNSLTKFEILRKLGEIGHQINTGAHASPSTAMEGATETSLSQETGMIQTPMVQGGDDGVSEDEVIGVASKISAYRHEYAPGQSGMLAIDEPTPEARAFNILSEQYANQAPPPAPLKDDLKGEMIGAGGGALTGIGAGLVARKLMPFRGPLSLAPVLGGAALGAVGGAGAGRMLERKHIARTNQEEQDTYREGLLQHLRNTLR